MKKERFLTTARMTRIAILGVCAFILMYFEFALPFIAPTFYKMDFSEIPVLIGGFALGPLSAVLIEFIKILLKLLFKPTTTAFVGELANFLVGCAFAVPAAMYYQKNRTRRGAMIALLIGVLCMAAAGFAINLWLVIPAYVSIMHFPLEAIIGAGQAIFPAVDSVFMLVLCCTTPFNLIKGVLLSVITVLLYKRVSPFLKQRVHASQRTAAE
ncbi:MAG: ECF transporter S component [Erysipelotrichaceae bacterium]|nr:ECF transporter S component [Erysipelotrichaceae bacterium]MBR3167181.1 ECF transporter S component [Erysipelotrichaceae bacterium]